MKPLRRVLAIATAVFFIIFVIRELRVLTPGTLTPRADLLITAVILAAISWIGFGAGWIVIVRRYHASSATPLALLRFWLQSQFTRYVPLNLGGFAGRMIFADNIGLSKKVAFSSLLIESGFAVATSLAVIAFTARGTGFFPVPPYLDAAVFVAALAVTLPAVIRRIGSRFRLEVPPLTAEATSTVVGIFLVAWLLAGAALTAGLRGVGLEITFFQALFLFAASWLAGYVAFFAPSGFGVRDGALIALIATVAPLPLATAAGVAARLFFTAGELVAVGLGRLPARFLAAVRRLLILAFPTPAVRRLALASVGLEIVLLAALLITRGEAGMFLPDSQDLYQLGSNVAAGHGFSKDIAAPFLPDGQRLPLYSLLIAASLFLTQHVWPIALLQILASTAIVAAAYRLTLALGGTFRSAHLAAGLAALEPLMLVWPITLLTESIFAALVAVALCVFLRTLRTRSPRDAAVTALFLGIASLTRQNGYPLFVLAFVALLIIARRRLAVPATFFAIYVIVVSPWLARNAVHFQRLTFTTNGPVNIYSDFAASVLAVANQTSYGEETNKLDTAFAADHGLADFREAKRDPRYGAEAVSRAVQIMREHPEATIKTELIVLSSFFTNDAYTFFLQRYGLLPPRVGEPFSPSLALVQEGPVAAARRIWDALGPAVIIAALGRLFWIAVTLAAAVGTWRAMAGAANRTAATTLAIAILYFAISSSVIGFGVNGRLRYPINVALFSLAAVGLIRPKRTV